MLWWASFKTLTTQLYVYIVGGLFSSQVTFASYLISEYQQTLGG